MKRKGNCDDKPSDARFPLRSTHADVVKDASADDGEDFILSQEIFCTPDYLTPDENCITLNVFGGDVNLEEDTICCPKSPKKFNSTISKCAQDTVSGILLSPSEQEQVVELGDETDEELSSVKTRKGRSYVSQSAVALRCRVMPPPCIKNPFLKDILGDGIDPFERQRSKCAGLFPSVTIGAGLSRYCSDFNQIEKIGGGDFSSVFKVLKRIDGCLYAVKRSTSMLCQENERTKALMEVQALAALDSHENIVRYYSSWFEDDHLYIQMELCDHSLSMNSGSASFATGQAVEALYQVAKALLFIHEKGIAHLDVKPSNVFVKNGVYKLGDFGHATLLDNSLPIEEGDGNYMPLEMLDEDYDHLDKVDIYSLGYSIYVLSGFQKFECQFLNLTEDNSLQLQSLLKVMMSSDPAKRPSARELLENPIFDRLRNTMKH